MRATKLMAFALAVSVIAVAMIVAGCATTGTPTPAPAPDATPTPSPTPAPASTISPVDKKYQYVERLQAGISEFNSALALMQTGKDYVNASDYANASRQMREAGEQMDAAVAYFMDMRQFASTPQELNLSQKWADTARYSAMSYRNASLAYDAYAYEIARPTLPNWVKYEDYVAQANRYNQLAAESRSQVDVLMAEAGFAVQTG